jgi:hypothetical protein
MDQSINQILEEILSAISSERAEAKKIRAEEKVEAEAREKRLYDKIDKQQQELKQELTLQREEFKKHFSDIKKQLNRIETHCKMIRVRLL